MDIQFEETDQTDKGYFWELYELSYRTVIEDQFGAWSESQQLCAFDRKWRQRGFRKIMLGGQLAGGIWLKESIDYHEITEIQIHPDFQHRGIGSAILKQEMARAIRQGKSLKLSVLFKSPAYFLYQKLGFQVVLQDDFQYQMEFNSQQSKVRLRVGSV
jgi:ribosomal protein S18 acetylase RimI-like enzyme